MNGPAKVRVPVVDTRRWTGRSRRRRGSLWSGLRLLPLVLVLIVLLLAGCGGDDEQVTAGTSEANQAASTTTTLTGFAAIAPEGFPPLDLPPGAVLLERSPSGETAGATVTAVYTHEGDVMAESAAWKDQLEAAGFDLDRNQAWKGGGIDGYILTGTTADGAHSIVIVGGDALAIERNPFYEVSPDVIPAEMEHGFVLVLDDDGTP